MESSNGPARRRGAGEGLHLHRDCQKFCVLSPVDLTIDLEPIAEHHGKLRLCRTPFASRHLPYMDAPLMPSAFFGPGSEEEFAAINPACACDSRSRALMEYAGRRLITFSDS